MPYNTDTCKYQNPSDPLVPWSLRGIDDLVAHVGHPWSAGPVVQIRVPSCPLVPESRGIIYLTVGFGCLWFPGPAVPSRLLSGTLVPWSLLGIDDLKVHFGRPQSPGPVVPIRYR